MTAPDAPDALETRCSTATAAKFLGCTRRHVEKLIRSGDLDAWNVATSGAPRARWSVAASSVRLLLLARHRKGSIPARKPPAEAADTLDAVRPSTT